MKAKLTTQHKVLIGASCVLIVFFSLSLARFVWVGAHQDLNPDAQQEQQEEQSKDNSDKGVVSKLPAYANGLDAKQTKDLQDFKDLLERSTWTNNGETMSLKFSDGEFTETTQKEVKTTEFKITGLQKGNTLESKDVQGLSYTANFITQKGSYLVNVVQLTLPNIPTPRLVINSDVFENSSSYQANKSASDIKVENIEGLKPYIAGHDKELISFVQETVSKHFPTVNMASWEGIATIDQKEKMIQFPIRLNNAAESQVNFFYHVDTQTFTTNCKDGTCDVR